MIVYIIQGVRTLASGASERLGDEESERLGGRVSRMLDRGEVGVAAYSNRDVYYTALGWRRQESSGDGI